MGVALNRQVQRRVSRMQILASARAVRHPRDRHLPEHRPQHTPMISFDPTTGHLVFTDNLGKALLTDGAQREMVIKQPAQKLPPVTVKTLLKPGVIKTSRVGPVHETDQRLELLTTRREPVHRRVAALAASVADLSERTTTTTAPERQDFAHRRVKFNSTGVEIGGHVRPPPWSTKDLNNADFDTRFMTPRPRPAPQRRHLPTPPNTPGQARPRVTNRPQAPLHHPGATPDHTANIRNLPDLQGTPRQPRPSSGHFRRAAPRCSLDGINQALHGRDAATTSTPTSPSPSTATPFGHTRSRSHARLTFVGEHECGCRPAPRDVPAHRQMRGRCDR